jgi:two-component system nitrogen regulation response regulator GlnG
MLTRHFLQQSAQQLGVEAKRISDSAIELLQNFAFPGNVRQLENICHWLTVMAPAQVIEVKDLPPEVQDLSTSPAALAPAVALASGMASAVNAISSPVAAAPATDSPTASDSGASAAFSGLGVNPSSWEPGLEQEALALLNAGRTDVWDALTRRFETSLIQAALVTTRGRRIEAAQKLGIGRNTITRKIQELGIDE